MKQTEGSEETGLLAQPTERVLGASLGAPPASQQGFSGGRCSALPPGLSQGSKTGAAPSRWRFSLREDNATALRFPLRKSLEVQEPKVLQCNPCPSAPTQSLLPEPMARAAPRCCCSQRISTTSIALQYEPVQILTCSMLLKPRPSACSAETLRDRGAEDHAGGSPALSGSRGIPFSPTNALCLLLPAPKAGCQWISPLPEVVSGRAGAGGPATVAIQLPCLWAGVDQVRKGHTYTTVFVSSAPGAPAAPCTVAPSLCPQSLGWPNPQGW